MARGGLGRPDRSGWSCRPADILAPALQGSFRKLGRREYFRQSSDVGTRRRRSGQRIMEQAFETGDVRGILHTPERPTGQALALTHGAGSDAHSPLLAGLSRAFCDAGLVVLRYDLPYRVVRPKGPPVPAGAARD